MDVFEDSLRKSNNLFVYYFELKYLGTEYLFLNFSEAVVNCFAFFVLHFSCRQRIAVGIVIAKAVDTNPVNKKSTDDVDWTFYDWNFEIKIFLDAQNDQWLLF